MARPAVGFPELRARLRKRLAHMGVVVTAIEEEEYCLIPMGGVLPRLPQRVLGIGGTAGMVHPSTGAPPPTPLRMAVPGPGCARRKRARQQGLGHGRHSAACV